jgi:hypothetical protein
MAEQPRHVSNYTGEDIESAISKALPLDSFEYQSDEVIDGISLHVLWKVNPLTNTTYGIAVHPNTGEILKVKSVNGTFSYTKYTDVSIESETLIFN